MGALLRSAPSVKRAWSHGSPISVLAVSPAGDRFFTGSHDGAGRLWSPSQDAPIGPALNHPADIVAAAFSRNGKLLLTGCADGAVRLWETAGGKLIEGPRRFPQVSKLTEPQVLVASVAFSRDGRMVLAVCGKFVNVLETNGLKSVGKPCRDAGEIVAAEFAEGASLIVTKTRQKQFSVWDVKTGEKQRHLGEPSESNLFAVAAEGSIVAVKQSSDSLVLWNCASGRKAVPSTLAHPAKVQSAQFSIDGTRLASGTSDGTVSLWDSKEGRIVWRSRLGHAEIQRLAFSLDGSQLAVQCTEKPDRWISVLECQGGKLVCEPLHLYSPLDSFHWSGDTRDLPTAASEGAIRLWRTESADSALRLPIESQIRNAAVSADRRTVAAFTRTGTGFVLLRGPGKYVYAKDDANNPNRQPNRHALSRRIENCDRRQASHSRDL